MEVVINHRLKLEQNRNWSSNFITEINECESFPCRGDQVCLDLIGSYKCRCPAGEFDTGRCESMLNESPFYYCIRKHVA